MKLGETPTFCLTTSNLDVILVISPKTCPPLVLSAKVRSRHNSLDNFAKDREKAKEANGK